MFFSALCGTNAAIRNDCRVNCIQGAALSYEVGYQNKELSYDWETDDNFSWVINTLPVIGKDKSTEITLGDLKVVFTDGQWDENSVIITTLGINGDTVCDYCYISEDIAGNYPFLTKAGLGAGWYEFVPFTSRQAVPADSVVVPFEAGVQATTDGCGAQITFSGEVLNDACPIPLQYDFETDDNFTWCGNCSPVPRQLKDIGVTFEDGQWDENSVVITTLGIDGDTVCDYCYISEDIVGNYPFLTKAGLGAGWYEFVPFTSRQAVPAGDVWIKAGECFQATTDGCGASVVIPKAID